MSRSTLKKVVPYLLVVAAAWGGSFLWYEENETRREEAVQQVVQEQYSEDVDACKRNRAGIYRPVHAFFENLTALGERPGNAAEARKSPLFHDAKRARKDTKPPVCLDVVAPPTPDVEYVADPGERAGSLRYQPQSGQ